MATPFNAKELQVISSKLDQMHSMGGDEMCNHIFGFHNWSSEIRELRLYYTTEEVSTDGTVLYSSGASAICRVVLRDGSHRDAVGCGDSTGAVSKVKSIDDAHQAAVREGLLRCVEQFQAGHAHSSYLMNMPCPYTAAPMGDTVLTSVASSSPAVSTGRKRTLPQDSPQAERMYPHTPAPVNNSSLAPQRPISELSPTMEDIDSLMQQYDQVDSAETAPAPTVPMTTAPRIHTASSDSFGSINASAAFGIPAQASLKGQKYPPKPVLQDPFGKSR